MALGMLVLYIPTFLDLLRGIWASDQHGHGPIVLALSFWLLLQKRTEFSNIPTMPRPVYAWALLSSAALAYALGRSQGILILEVGSFIVTISGVILLLSGTAQLRVLWFPIFFMCFMIPLPGPFVDALTQPMKIAVSYFAEQLLYAADYPVSRMGVTLEVGPYRLLVADACAGLQTLFTLEALGLFYLNVVHSPSLFRNVALAILIIPISFCANVIRVLILTLITYHFGDAAGQGFLHSFAGIALFLAALVLILLADSALRIGNRLIISSQR